MAREALRIVRGTAGQVAAYTGPAGEPVYNSDAKRIHIQDGATAGGVPLARLDEVPTDLGALATKDTVGTADIADDAVSGLKLAANSVTGSKISNGVVTNAKLANMSTGLIKGRASSGGGAPEDLTAAQVLTVLGLDGMKRRDVVQLSSEVAAVDLATPSGAQFARFKAVIDNAGAVAVLMRVSTDSGSTYRTGASDYSFGYSVHNAAASTVVYSGATTSGTSWGLSTTANSTGVPVLIDGELWVGSATARARVGARSTSYDTTQGMRVFNMGGHSGYAIGSIISNIRFLLASGNIPAGSLFIVEWF